MGTNLRYWAEKDPERIALEFVSAPPVTYAQLEARSNRFAQLFRSVGLKAGDHICGIFPNGPEVIAAIWAAYRCGLYYTPVAHTLSRSELAYIVDNSQSRLVLTHGCFAEKLRDIETRCKRVEHRLAIDCTSGWQDLEAALAQMPDVPVVDETHGALMMYTSGTTGAPKGIWRPLPNHSTIGDGPPAIVGDLTKIFEFDANTRFLSPAPLYHAAPLRWSLAISASGETAFIMDRFDAEQVLDIMETRSITMSQWVPTMFRRMLALSKERKEAFKAPAHVAAWHGAAPCPPWLKQEMINWWGPILEEYYAGTESIGITHIKSSEWLQKPGSVGRAVKGALHILNDTGEEVAPGTIGRVYFDPPSKFTYFHEPEMTARKTSAQGWQTLGEIGFVDAEGYLFLTDRQDDMIISGGVNIYPQELEQVIERLPEVFECCVVGISDDDFGERPIAFIVPAKNAPEDEDLVELVRAHCQEMLGRIKQPDRYHIIADLPRSEAGKTLRRVLRDRLMQDQALDGLPQP